MAMICKIMVMSWQGHGNDVQKVRVCIFDSLDIDVSVGPSVFQNMTDPVSANSAFCILIKLTAGAKINVWRRSIFVYLSSQIYLQMLLHRLAEKSI